MVFPSLFDIAWLRILLNHCEKMKQKTTDSFRKWLSELSWSSLQDHLQFELEESEEALFREMIKLQAPPPTPIHPRAIPYKSCQAEASDGRDPVAKRRKDIKTRPRWFKFVQDDRGRIVLQARNFEGQASERCHQRLTLGCTLEQNEMDRAVQEGTFAVIRRNNRIAFRYLGRPADSSLNDKARKRMFLRMIKVAARGKFASEPPAPDVAWLKPTRQWFSLSKYLASRYESALWKAFRGAKPLSKSDELSFSFRSLPEDTILAIVSQAVAAQVKQSLLKNLDLNRLLDSFIWRLIECSWSDGYGSLVRPQLRSLHLLSLEDMADERMVGMKISLCQEVQERLTIVAAESLLGELVDEEPFGERQIVSEKKKGRRKKTSKKQPHVLCSDGCAEAIEEEKSIDDSMTDTPLLTFPKNDTSSRERNRNLIFVLSIMEEVILDVYQRVGLSITPTQTTALGDDKIVQQHGSEMFLPPRSSSSSSGANRNWIDSKVSRSPVMSLTKGTPADLEVFASKEVKVQSGEDAEVDGAGLGSLKNNQSQKVNNAHGIVGEVSLTVLGDCFNLLEPMKFFHRTLSHQSRHSYE